MTRLLSRLRLIVHLSGESGKALCGKPMPGRLRTRERGDLPRRSRLGCLPCLVAAMEEHNALRADYADACQRLDVILRAADPNQKMRVVTDAEDTDGIPA